MFDELKESIMDSIKLRVNSPFYGAFLISWLVVNWQVIIIILFVSEENIWNKTELLKSEFIFQFFLNPLTCYFWLNFILVAGLTCLIIWVLPKYVTQPAYEAQQKDSVAKANIKVDAESELLDKELTNLAKEKEKIEAEKEIEIGPEKEWEKQYRIFVKSKFYQDFDKIITSIYSKQGQLNWFDDSTSAKLVYLPEDLLVYAHSHQLVELTDKKKRIELTDKGRFFVKLYNSEKSDGFLKNIGK